MIKASAPLLQTTVSRSVFSRTLRKTRNSFQKVDGLHGCPENGALSDLARSAADFSLFDRSVDRVRGWWDSSTTSFTEVLQELPALTVAERQWLIRRALDLDEAGLSAEDEAVVKKRLADHRRNPGSGVPLDEIKTRVRYHFGK